MVCNLMLYGLMSWLSGKRLRISGICCNLCCGWVNICSRW